MKNILKRIGRIFYNQKIKNGYCTTRIFFFKLKRKLSESKIVETINYGSTLDNNRIIIYKDNQEIYNPSSIKNLNISFAGKNNLIEIHEPCTYGTVNNINIHGNDCKLILNKCTLNSLTINMQHQAYCFIDEQTTIGGYFHFANERNLSLKVGKDCMFSGQVAVWGTDGHIITDKNTDKCINRTKNGIVIGDHCWIGYRSTILKNTILQANTIVGAESVVRGHFDESNIIIAGNPAKKIKENIEWQRNPLD